MEGLLRCLVAGEWMVCREPQSGRSGSARGRSVTRMEAWKRPDRGYGRHPGGSACGLNATHLQTGAESAGLGSRQGWKFSRQVCCRPSHI